MTEIQILLRKNDLLNRLKAQEKISAADETWLDQEGNYVDEEAFLNTLRARYHRFSLSSDDTSSNLLSDLEQSVSDSLDALEARGVLQKNNRVDLEDLVNTAVEMIEGEELSEKEICRAIFQ